MLREPEIGERSSSQRAPGVTWSLVIFRIAAGVAAVWVTFFIVPSSRTSLRWAVGLLGAFIFLHQALEGIALILARRGHEADRSGTSGPSSSFESIGAALLSTPGVVLGLLAVFAPAELLTFTIRVSAISLAFCLLLAIVSNALVAMTGAEHRPLSTLIRALFNVTLWSLALGVLGISMALWFRGEGG
jgi:hypothetical protein